MTKISPPTQEVAVRFPVIDPKNKEKVFNSMLKNPMGDPNEIRVYFVEKKPGTLQNCLKLLSENKVTVFLNF